MTEPVLPIIREAIAAHGMLTKLGFSSDHLYLRSTGGRLFITLRSDGKEFNLDVGAHTLSDDEIVKAWRAACAWWNPLPQPERSKFVDASEARKELVMVITTLHAKGFTFDTQNNMQAPRWPKY